ncbi:Permease of the drug/metabolite transporter (DMT) superfamily [Lysobacter dokdonensis DS-58]|uniref:Permease of the drug/metabolite transporter (DMT) superfamily n=1 Tax=Lysobacter dokdonensis DS-58 TaxID=1300345 RepID=A0A0A2WH88_9GAMM|nr:DMT family transporter [Lysobacter dokdonensis]KGQ19561.1 Permease of the drug/metabolite transporter (DMT) superfamily [Lysobacter dokdonensis DS-58]
MSSAAARGPLATMLLGAVLISTSAVFVRWVDMGPTASAFWRMALAAGMLLPVLAVAIRRGVSTFTPTPRVLGLVAIAAVFFALDLWMWHRSILFVGVGMATLLGNFQVFVLAGYGALLLGEHGGWRLWAGLSLAVAGLALMLVPGWSHFDARFHVGVWFGLGTAAAYAGFLIAFRKAQGTREGASNESLLWWMCVFTAVLLLPMALAGGEALPPKSHADWGSLLAYALIAQVCGWLVIGKAMPKLTAGVLGLCLLLQPLMAYVWDALLFGTRLDALGMIGLALSLAGIFLGLTRGAGNRAADA